MIEEKEAEREATRQRDAQKRMPGDPNHRAAEMVFRALGDQWPEFVRLIGGGTMDKMGTALNRIAGEHAARAKHRDLNGAPAIRQDREQAVVASRHTGIEVQLALAGVRLDFSPE